MRLITTVLAFCTGTAGALADVPRVVTDIAPVQGLVDQVMQGAGAAAVLLPPGASPHSYAMRPSEARALAGADLIIWVGPSLTPWLADPVVTLAGEAQLLTLMETEGMTLLPFRTGAAFEAHGQAGEAVGAEKDQGEAAHSEHNHDEAAHADHGHDDHAGHGHGDHGDHGDHADHADHGHDAATHEEHAHGHDHAGGIDPHIWLDPRNAQIMLGAVAETLAGLDPDNAGLYRGNAQRAADEIAAASGEVSQALAGMQDVPFIVFHDAFYYFEARFGLSARAAISLAHGEAASAGHLSAVRALVQQTGATCVLAEPPVQQGLIDAVAGAGGLRLVEINPLGVENSSDTWRYTDYLMSVAQNFSRCLAPA